MAKAERGKTSFSAEVAGNLWGGVLFCAGGFWKWTVLSAFASAFYVLGITAMYGGNYILAAGFCVVGIVLLAARWIADACTHEKKGGAILVIAFLSGLALFGSLFWIKHTYETQTHNANTFSRVAATIWQNIVAVWQSIYWRWALPSLLLGVILSSIVTVVRNRKRAAEGDGDSATRSTKCAYEWLHDLANRQAQEIGNHVELEQPYPYDIRLTDSIPSIGIKFPIRNQSVLDISIDNKLEGKVYFAGRELAEPVIIKHCGENIPYRQLDGLAIEQRLTRTEADHIASSTEGFFDFQNLLIMIKGGVRTPEVKPQPLRITSEHVLRLHEPPSSESLEIAALQAERDSLQSQIEKRDLLVLEVDTDISFSPNLQEVQSHVFIVPEREGIKERVVWAKVRVRFNNTNVNTNRICHLQISLLRSRDNKDEQFPCNSSGGSVQRDSGPGGHVELNNMEVPGSRMTEYFWMLYHWTVLDVAELEGAFIKITMEALRQPVQTFSFDVDWERALDKQYSSLSPSVLTVRD